LDLPHRPHRPLARARAGAGRAARALRVGGFCGRLRPSS
jgi:hypothetical protein